MKQKTINQNKLLTILCIIALTLGVLVSAVLFCMPPVHAEEANNYIYNMSTIEDMPGSSPSRFTREFEFHSSIDIALIKTDYTRTFISGFSGEEVTKYGYFPIYLTSDKKDINGSKNIYYGGSLTRYAGTKVDKTASYEYGNPNSYMTFNSVYYSNFVESSCSFFFNEVETSMKIFNSVESAIQYVENGDTSGIINGESPNTTDEAYTFTGFSINGKTARWTGTTERSYLKDQDVEEYTTITYAWATTTEPDNIGTFQEYNGEFPTSAKQLKLPWSDMESGKVDFQFIRQVNIIPCYRVPGAFYHGQAVKIFFKPDGTLDRIEQVTIPSDSETIGNDISLIGFRYDSSFHAEWVDVWSNGANKSAFDLTGSQYLSLGIKAVYYDGSKSDIDFFTLDRKNLVWDKTFTDFKENNGSPIKSLYFTPYAKTGVDNPWNKGNSTVVNFDENGNPSSVFDTGDDGTVHLNDFKLTGVVWNKPVVQSGTITWTGTTPNSDLLFIPDSDTLVVATYPRYDSDMNASYETWSTTTIGKGSMKVNVDYLIDYYKNSELAWNGEMWLTPCYKKGGVLYMGEPVIINCLKGTVSDIVVDKDSGKAEQVDKTDQNKSDADSILNVGNQFYSIINGLIGSLQQLPALLTAIFGFLPSSIINLIYASFAVIIICRILGR